MPDFLFDDRVIITEAIISPTASVREFSVVTRSVVGEGTRIGPFAHVLNECEVGAFCQIGNFVVLDKCNLSDNVKINHHSALVYVTVGEDTIIGAGCMIDIPLSGASHTIIGANVFVGSSVCLASGIEIGDNVIIGAGSNVNCNLPSNSFFVNRPRTKTLKVRL